MASKAISRWKLFKRKNGEHVKVICTKSSHWMVPNLIDVQVLKNGKWEQDHNAATENEQNIVKMKLYHAINK